MGERIVKPAENRFLLRDSLYTTFQTSPEARQHVLHTEGKPYVLHVICNMEIGGSQKIILDLFERLSDRYRMKILTGHIPFYVRYPDLPIAVLNTDSAIRDFLRQ